MSSQPAAVKQALAKFLKLPADQIADTMELKGLVRDSFMLVELLIELQEEFGVRLCQTDAEQLHTVAELTGLIAERARETA